MKKSKLIIPASVGLVYAVNPVDQSVSIFWQERSSGFYELPGGKIQNNESPLEALEREIKEEASFLKLNSPWQFFGIYSTSVGEKSFLLHLYTAQGDLLQMTFGVDQELKTFEATRRMIDDFRKSRV
jgi:8-oxo-dGTP pyrophosphatase MutT (NUDIX family)